MQHLEGSGTPVLYIGRTVLKGQKSVELGVSYFCALVTLEILRCCFLKSSLYFFLREILRRPS